MVDYPSFQEYCIDIENIPYYNFLSPEEFDAVWDRYDAWLEKTWYVGKGRIR